MLIARISETAGAPLHSGKEPRDLLKHRAVTGPSPQSHLCWFISGTQTQHYPLSVRVEWRVDVTQELEQTKLNLSGCEQGVPSAPPCRGCASGTCWERGLQMGDTVASWHSGCHAVQEAAAHEATLAAGAGPLGSHAHDGTRTLEKSVCTTGGC